MSGKKPPVKSEGQGAVDPAGELRAQLVKRVSVAAVLVALLLGALTVFDYLSQTPDDDDAPVFTQPVPVAPRKPLTQPVTPVDSVPAPPVEEKPAEAAAPAPTQAVEPPPAPEVKADPALVPAQPAANQPTPPKAVRPAPRPAADPRPVSEPRAAAEPRPPVVPKPELPVVPEATAPLPMQPARPLATQPPGAPAEPARIVARESGAANAPRLFSGFVLQAGVFRSAQRAEELHAQLTLSGVPSTVETRVQVGPFKTRQEAEAAQRKLRELGVESVIVAPAGKR